jgi:hypothetical protein
MAYATAADVKAFMTVKPEDVKRTDATIDAYLTVLIKYATVKMNAYMGRSYSDAAITADSDLKNALESVCVSAVDNYLQNIVVRRKTPIVTVGEYKLAPPPDRIILTKEMKDELTKYRASPAPLWIEGTERFTSDETGLITDPEESEDEDD